MTREEFINVAEETLDSLPEEFRSRMQNVAILVKDYPPKQSRSQPGQQRQLLLGIFHGVPATKKSVFDLSAGPKKDIGLRRAIRRLRVEALWAYSAHVHMVLCAHWQEHPVLVAGAGTLTD